MITRFTVYRPRRLETHDENQQNPPSEPQFEGAIFSDGTTVLRWLTACRSCSVWDDFESMLKIHGHPEYGTQLVWHDRPGDYEADAAAPIAVAKVDVAA